MTHSFNSTTRFAKPTERALAVHYPPIYVANDLKYSSKSFFMPHKQSRFQFSEWLLTPAEMSVLALAGVVIWVAKVQDGAMGQASFAAPKPRLQESGLLYLPPGRYRNPSASTLPADTTEAAGVAATLDEKIQSIEQDHFLRRFAAQQKLRSGAISQKQWDALLKNASVTFGLVEKIFAEASPGAVPSQILDDPTLAAHVFIALEKHFGIPVSASESFSKNGSKSLAEWALFVEQRQGQ